MKPPADSQAAMPLTGGLISEQPTSTSARRRSLPAPALSLLTDERLARMAGAGDTAAFAVIFQRYHQRLYRYCLSIVRNSDDAGDALQSTMLRALNALRGETREIALRPWLYRIAFNESITLLRRQPAAAPEQGLAGSADVEHTAA